MSSDATRSTAPGRVTIYTDGGASPNPGPGGWGAVLIDPRSGRSREISGGENPSTNNRMELQAAIQALESLKRPCEVDLYTDSQYLRRGITSWLPQWRRQGWKRKQGEIQNLDLWRQLQSQADRHRVTWHWVKGHAGNAYNERADELATQEIRRHGGGDANAPVPATADVRVYLKITNAAQRGAWAAHVEHGEEEQTLTGRRDGLTANQLDLHAAAEILAGLPPNLEVAIVTGSQYLRQGASQWLPSWRQRGWKTKEGAAVKNATAWRRLGVELGKRRVVWPEADAEADARLKKLGKVAKALMKEA